VNLRAGSGGLGALSTIDVSASGDPLAALGAIEGLIDTAIDAAASLGSSAGRLETQSDFISKLTKVSCPCSDNTLMKSGAYLALHTS